MRSALTFMMICLIGIVALMIAGMAGDAWAQSGLYNPGSFTHQPAPMTGPGSSFAPTRPPVPSFQFEDKSGRALDMSDFRGRFVLLNLWATWCGPCVEEMPSLDALQSQFPPDRLIVVAIAEDHDGLFAGQNFYMHRNIRFLNLYADPSGQSVTLLRARGLPTTLLIDPNGVEVTRFEGAVDWTSPRIITYFHNLVH